MLHVVSFSSPFSRQHAASSNIRLPRQVKRFGSLSRVAIQSARQYKEMIPRICSTVNIFISYWLRLNTVELTSRRSGAILYCQTHAWPCMMVRRYNIMSEIAFILPSLPKAFMVHCSSPKPAGHHFSAVPRHYDFINCGNKENAVLL